MTKRDQSQIFGVMLFKRFLNVGSNNPIGKPVWNI